MKPSYLNVFVYSTIKIWNKNSKNNKNALVALVLFGIDLHENWLTSWFDDCWLLEIVIRSSKIFTHFPLFSMKLSLSQLHFIIHFVNHGALLKGSILSIILNIILIPHFLPTCTHGKAIVIFPRAWFCCLYYKIFIFWKLVVVWAQQFFSHETLFNTMTTFIELWTTFKASRGNKFLDCY